MPSVEEELNELALTAANSLVAAMGTELWPTVGSLVRRMLTRRGQRRAELTEALDRLAVAGAMPAEPGPADSPGAGGGAEGPGGDCTGFDTVQAVRFWADALAELVWEDGTLRPALAALAGLARPAQGPEAVHQQNTAHGFGRVYANQYGAQHFYSSERQEPK
jgi:hypothetical protein